MTQSDNEYLFTSESVTEGHPDKIADQISDTVLDAVLADDPYGRVACETLVNTGLVVVAGEITTTTVHLDIPELVRGTVREIGYDNAAYGFDCNTCAVISTIDRQSPDIAQGVDTRARAARRRLRRRARRRRRGRPGHDVRLRDPRDARADAACRSRSRTASRGGSPRSARTARCPTCARTARRRSACATATAGRSRSRSC